MMPHATGNEFLRSSSESGQEVHQCRKEKGKTKIFIHFISQRYTLARQKILFLG